MEKKKMALDVIRDNKKIVDAFIRGNNYGFMLVRDIIFFLKCFADYSEIEVLNIPDDTFVYYHWIYSYDNFSAVENLTNTYIIVHDRISKIYTETEMKTMLKLLT